MDINRIFSLAKSIVFRPDRLLIIDPPPRPLSRWGHGKASHPKLVKLIADGRSRYRAQLEEFLVLTDDLLTIARERVPGTPRSAPVWKNSFLPALDAVALYGILALGNPSRFFEIGSGNSTMFARRAIHRQKLRTEITSIDPCPRANVDSICDHVYRTCLEDMDVAIFDQLESGDVLFFDGSHYVFTNSDVVVLMFDILPRLAPGVLVHLHDIWLPDDYPPHWSNYWFAEQYVLGCYLLGGACGVEVMLPNWFISMDADLSSILAPLWKRSLFSGLSVHGASFWLRTRAV